MLYARMNDKDEIDEIREFGGELELEDISKDLFGHPMLRPVTLDDSQPAPYQVLQAFTYEILDDRVIRHNVFEDRVEDFRARALVAIDDAAELARQKYITPGAGQAMTYQEKADEARDYLADPAPNADNYPLLAAEVGVTANSIGAVALVIRGRHLAFKQIGAAIEKARLTAKAAVVAAKDGPAIQTAADVTWP